MADAIDEFTLLCESCGYPLAGLPAEGKCPECGKPIAESSPNRRKGSRWQQRPSVGTWLLTSAATLRQPARLFGEAKIELRRSTSLVLLNISISIAMIATPVALTGSALKAIDVFGIIVGGWLAFAALTAIEGAGVIFFGRRRRWRVTPTIATVICAHASVGWIGAAALGIAGAYATGSVPASDKGLGLTLWLLDQLLPVLGFFLGLLAFETLVYIGIRRCRFANRMPPAPDA